jgi:hypothetical protein
MVDIEKDLSYEPVDIPCASPQQIGAMIPLVRFTNAKGERRTADVRDLTRDGYVARITRQVYRDVESRLARGKTGLPPAVEAIRDSLSKLSTAGCPYSISLSGPKGIVRTFDYGAGEVVMSARVICTRTSGEVVVRVDLEKFAEVLVFEPDGTLLGRFIFSTQLCTQRNDIIVALGRSPIIELDFESNAEKGRYIHWAPALPQ